MKCAACQFENEAGAAFCENCGAPIHPACPNCGNPVKAGARFCKTCGAKLGAESAAAAQPSAPPTAQARAASLDALRQAVPTAVAEKIRAQRGHAEGERKLVTALFTDIVGSTALAERMDPEDWRDIVTGSHQRVSDAVYKYEGTIAQLLGDGVLAFFGAPIAHEDDAERALHSALEILEAMRRYAAELRRARNIPDFQIRIGLNTGLVVVGNIGSDLHMEYLAVGDTLNLAARIQSAADPDTILISRHTHRLAAQFFDVEDRGEISVKGKAEAVHVYRVLGAKKGATRARGVTGLASPLVGRGRELTTLADVLADAQTGRGSLVAIVGEAGLGKSRLIAEWRKLALAGDMPARWVEGRCLSYTMNVAHHLSNDILRGLCGAPPGARDDETHAALEGCMARLPAAARDEVYPFLAHLLGLPLDEAASNRIRYLDGAALQARYVSAYQRFLLALGKECPTIIICDDTHWADPSSIELVSQLARIAAQAPVVFVFVTRPERDAPGWRLISDTPEKAGVGSIELKLAPLSDNDSRQLVSNLLEVEDLPDRVRDLILNKAEGNPFFVEEVLRMLIDRGGIVRASPGGAWAATGDIQTIDIPDTLQGVLAARIDRLPEETKRVLQIASVIGRRFQVSVLEAVLARQGLL